MGIGWNSPTRAGAKAKSVILIFNPGAPSHLDLWDPKPEASAKIRGEFRTIDSRVPGIRVSELLPDLARRMNQLAVLRTVSHTHSAHNAGMYWSIVGRPYRIDNTLINPEPHRLSLHRHARRLARPARRLLGARLPT